MGVSPTKPKTKPSNRRMSARAFLVLDWSIAAIWVVIAYATASLALDSGSWWHYGATALALYFIVRSLKIAVSRSHGKR